MKTTAPQNRVMRAIRPILMLVAMLGCFWNAAAHNLDTRATGISFANDFVQTMSQRASLNEPLVQVGDEFWVLLKTTPGPGTTTGVGGYQTYYVPGGVQVLDVAYVQPSTTDPRGFIIIPMKGQSPIAIGDGPIGAKAEVGLVTNGVPVTLGPNILGVTQAAVTSSGLARGTIAGVYADTGIFFSTDPATAFNSYGAALVGGNPPMVNNSGDTVGEWDAANVLGTNVLGVMTLWDSWQLRAFGRKDVAAIIDPADERGNAPWGMASAVAGPQSGYAWSFDYDTYLSKGGNVAAISQAIEVGPWQRIQYPGSQVSKDQAGLVSTMLGYAGVDASHLGYDIQAAPLPANVNAIRFAIGQLELGRPEYSAVKIHINDTFAAQCYRMYADAFGGDAGGTDNGKDHIWRYFDPTVVTLNPCVLLQKVAVDPLIPPGGTTSFKITFANTGTEALPNISLVDVLPSGLAYLSAVPAPNTISGSTLTWNVGTVAPGDVVTLTIYVKATATGTLLNTVKAVENNSVIAEADDTVEVSLHALLREEKTVMPSSVAPGANVTYTITVYNDGTGPNGLPLIVTDFLPTGFTFVSLVSATINGAAIVPTMYTTNLNKPVFVFNQGIQADKTAVIKFIANVSSSALAGTYYNGVELGFEGMKLGPIPEAPVIVAGGQIGDTIFRDWNGNGLQDPGEEPLPGVTVTLTYYGADGVLGGGDDVVTTKVTDANGNYLFTGLVAGNYQVTVPAPGSGGVPAGYVLTADPDGGSINSDFSITLPLNTAYLTADFGYRPGGAGSIGDKVFDDKNGDGLFNGSDVGIDGATVDLYEDTNGNGLLDSGDVKLATTTTSGGGNYAFPGLATGLSYLVDVNEPTVSGYFSPNTFTSTTGSLEAVHNLTGSYNDADFGYIANLPGSIGDTVFADFDNNGIYDNGDTPIANITIYLYRDSNSDGVADGPPIATAVTDPAGQYTFAGLAPNTYLVVIEEEDADVPGGYVPAVTSYSIPLAQGQNVTTADFPFVAVLDKTVNAATAVAGQTLTYTIRPYWPGPDLLVDANLVDPVPAGTTYVAGSANAEGVHDGSTPGTITWALGNNSPDVPGVTAGSGTALCPAVPLTNVAVADTYITQKAGDTAKNYGNAGDLLTKAKANEFKHTLIRFNISAVPPNAIISSATFQIRVITAQGGNSVRIHNMFTSWTEGNQAGLADPNGASWEDSDGTAGPGDWTSGTFSAADYSSAVYGVIGTASTGIKQVDVTDLVKQWYVSGINKGMLLEATTTGATGDVKFDTRTDANPPTLVIKYFIQSTSPCGGPTTLDAVADTYVRQDGAAANQNFGSAVAFDTQPELTKIRHGLVRFDLSGIPLGATISSASLQLTVETKRDNNHTDQVRQALTAWTETGATWNDSDGSGSGDWTSGAFSSSDYGTTVYGSINPTPDETQYSVNVTSLVNDWVNNGVPNRGFAIVSTGTDNNPASYHSRESTTPAKRPKLVVNWTQPVNTLPQTTTELRVSPLLISSAQNVTVQMTVTAAANVNNVTPPASLTLNLAGSVTAVQVGSVSPAGPVNLTANIPVTFTYIYTVTPGLIPREISFTGKPSSPNAGFAVASSQGLIVTPPLTFQATVNSPVSVDIVNTAHFFDSGAVDATDTAYTTVLASIGDFVWADVDGDGSQDPGEAGIPNVRVFLDGNNNGILDWTDTNENGLWDSGEGERWVLTDAYGQYHIYGLAAGTSYKVSYDLSSAPAGYSPSTAHILTTPVLTAGQQYSDADFGLRPPGTSSVGDTVWLDRNNNGLVDSGESGIPDLDVRLYLDVNNNGLVDAGDTLLSTTSTDATGAYLFSGLHQGDYIVDVVESDPQFPAGVALVSGGSPVNTPPANGVQVVHITSDNTTVTTADFGYNYTGQIGDYVWWDADHDGLQDTGEAPIAGAFVMLYVDANNNGIIDQANGDYQFAGKLTDSNGQYLFSNLPPGNYLVDVYEDSIAVTGAEPVATTAPVVAVSLPPGGQILTADFGYFQGARVEGNVFWDADRNAYPDVGEMGLSPVTVTLTGNGPDGLPGTGDDVVMTTTTDAAGHFSFIVPEGDYTLTYSTANVLAINPSLNDPTTPTSYSFHAYPGEDWHPVFNFGVDNSGKIGDTIFADVNSSGIQDPGEAGLANVTVQLYVDANNNNQVDAGDSLLESQLTDATGNYLFVGLADTNYVVKVLTSTLPSGYQTTPTAHPSALSEWVAGSEAGATVSGGNVVLDRDFGYPETVTVFSVSGNIWSDTDGNHFQNGGETNLANVTVTITVGGLVYTVTTDAFGNYTLAGVPAGSAVTVTVNTSTLPNSAFVQNTDPDGTMDNQNSFTMPASDVTGKNFSYQQQFGSIAGTVVWGNGNGTNDVGVDTPLAGATLNLRYAGADGILNTPDDVVSTSLPTGSNGEYLFTGLLPGLYEITKTDPAGYYPLADADGGNPNSIIVTLGLGQNLDGQDFEDNYYKLSGNVFDDANGLADAIVNGTGTSVGDTLFVNLIDETGHVVGMTNVQSDGTYTLDHVGNGNYTVQVSMNQGVIGQLAPVTALPVGWTNTGENLGAGAGNDGSVNGLLAVTIAGANVSNANFGLDQLPNSNDASAAFTNPGGNLQVYVPALTGMDPEDGALGTGKTLVITSLPVDGTLYYNGVPVILGQVITNYTPNKLTADPAFDGNGTVSFTYAFIDAAGKVDPTPATVTLTFNVPTLALLKSIRGYAHEGVAQIEWETASEVGTLAFDLYRKAPDGSWTVVNPVLVVALNSIAGGTYSVPDPAAKIPGTYTYKLVEWTTDGEETVVGTYTLTICEPIVMKVGLADGKLSVHWTGGMPPYQLERRNLVSAPGTKTVAPLWTEIPLDDPAAAHAVVPMNDEPAIFRVRTAQ